MMEVPNSGYHEVRSQVDRSDLEKRVWRKGCFHTLVTFEASRKLDVGELS